jgi:hypothetical protein
MGAYEHVGQRLSLAMIKRGYHRADGTPDVTRFCWDFRYDRTLVYDWLGDRATPFKDLIRLCRDLGVTAEWLLTGEERIKKARPRRDRGGIKSLWLVWALAAAAAGSPSGLRPAQALAMDPAIDSVRLIGSRRRVMYVNA